MIYFGSTLDVDPIPLAFLLIFPFIVLIFLGLFQCGFFRSKKQ